MLPFDMCQAAHYQASGSTVTADSCSKGHVQTRLVDPSTHSCGNPG